MYFIRIIRNVNIYIITKEAHMKRFIFLLTFFICTIIGTYEVLAFERVHILNTKQSDCILVEGKEGAFLIDCGWESHEGYIKDYLVNKGIKKLDFIILTHYHDDHIGGIKSLCKEFHVDKVYMSPHKNLYRDDLHEYFTHNNVGVDYIKVGWTLNSKDMSLRAIGPIKVDKEIENNNSIAISANIDGIKYLFMGDAEKEEEEDMVKNNLVPNCDVLKVAHHGLNTSSIEKFLEKAKPQISIITTDGEESPEKEVINRLNKINSKIFMTHKNEDIIIGRNKDTKEFEILVNPMVE